jgi:hypothetical protein
MKVKIIDRPEMMGVELIVYEERADGVVVALEPPSDASEWRARFGGSWVPVQYGAEAPVFATVSEDLWHAIMAALNPPVEGAADQIKRERELTERLLGMVERQWDSGITG